MHSHSIGWLAALVVASPSVARGAPVATPPALHPAVAAYEASPFASTAMTQPGQPPFLEGFSGNQGVGSAMNQPGVADFYEGFGFNRGVTPPNQGAEPATPYPNYTTVLVPGNPGVATDGTYGFYNGFGAGQPDVGFYAGFTTPR
jgi:hypothetical protein